MTARTIKLDDTYCTAANWQSSIDSNERELAHLLSKDRWGPWVDEVNQEITSWSKKRDKALAKLRTINDGLTDYEKAWVRRKCGGERLAQDFLDLGVEPSWVNKTSV
jgi:hypothetical protein